MGILREAYLIIDVGTGNVRTAVVSAISELIALNRENVHYEKDDDYPDSIAFVPARLWKQIKRLTARTLADAGPVQITAITVTSQREGIVALDGEGKALIGMSTHDNRGREFTAHHLARTNPLCRHLHPRRGR